MRHRKRRSKLGMMTSHRNATMRNMVKNLLKYQRIQTTLARAKETRRLAEKLISLSKSDTIASRRNAYRVLTDRDLVTRLFKEVAPLFKDRNSGYTRIITAGFRRGDAATMAILELTEKKMVERAAKKKGKAKAAEAAKPQSAARGRLAEKPQAAKEAKGAVEEKKEELKIKQIPKSKPTLEEEKRTEKAKIEDKKIADKKGFMKNLRGFFRRKTDM